MIVSGPIWITGAHGFIGQRLARHCADSGQLVCGVGHGSWPAIDAAQSGVSHWINGDVAASNLQALRVAGGLPTAVIHLAGGSSVGTAIAHPHEDFLRTVESTAALLEWIRQESPATRLVVASSAAVYGAAHDGPIVEAAALCPGSPYGVHKLMMETLCRSYGSTYGISTVVARLFSVYGAGLRKQLLWDLCCKLAAPGPSIELGGDGQELRDWLDVADAVSVLASLPAIATPEVPTLNVATGVGTSVRRVANLVLKAWRIGDGQDRQLAFSGVARPGDPRSLVADPSLLAAQGLRCAANITKGAAEYVHWFRSRTGDRS